MSIHFTLELKLVICIIDSHAARRAVMLRVLLDNFAAASPGDSTQSVLLASKTHLTSRKVLLDKFAAALLPQVCCPKFQASRERPRLHGARLRSAALRMCLPQQHMPALALLPPDCDNDIPRTSHGEGDLAVQAI